MTSPAFSSCLAGSLSRYVRLRRLANGSDYGPTTGLLLHWDRFLCRQGWNLPLVTRELAEGYARTLAQQPAARSRRMAAVRRFCLYLRQSQPRSHVPERWLTLPSRVPRIPYIFTEQQIQSLMKAARGMRCAPLQRLAYSTLLGMLYTTGLRIGEALALNLCDVQGQPPALLVRQGKFRKDRWVPLSASAARALQRYICLRIQSRPRHADAPLWLGSRRCRAGYTTVYEAFRRLLAQRGIRSQPGPGPRLHDLRHSFAVRRLLAWYRQGRDVNALLPALATYMGHAAIGSTQVYLQATAELLEQANRRFADSFRRQVLTQGGPS